jgi:ubiquinone/menaquinone biosynthesis C-methylase UbiE
VVGVRSPAADGGIALRYEAWFDTPFGRRADRVERAILADLLASFDGAYSDRANSLLDVGCGTAHFLDLWPSRGPAAVGVDISRPILRYIQKYRPGFPIGMGDATALPFQDNSFDVVAQISIREFLESPGDSLGEAERVARKGITLGVLNSLSPGSWWRRVSGSRSYRHAHLFSPREQEHLVRRSLHHRGLVTEQHGYGRR